MEWNRTRMHISLKTQGQLFGKITSSAQDYKIISAAHTFHQIAFACFGALLLLKSGLQSFCLVKKTHLFWMDFFLYRYILFITVTFDHYVIFCLHFCFMKWVCLLGDNQLKETEDNK